MYDGTVPATYPTARTASTTRPAPPGTPGVPMAASASELTRCYGEGETRVVALDAVTVGFPRGAFTAIMGPSGSGKSTLMHCMAGLDSIDGGSARIGDTELGGLKDKELTRLRRERIGFVFQAYNLLPTLSARENVTLPLSVAGRRPDRQWFDHVIAAVGLGDRLEHRPSQLSGGQQQRVAVARALAGQPEIIFADEPTGNLDSRSGAEVLALLSSSVRQLGQNVVMVTHDPVAASYADRAVFLADGRVVDELDRPDSASLLERMRGLTGGDRPTGRQGAPYGPYDSRAPYGPSAPDAYRRR